MGRGRGWGRGWGWGWGRCWGWSWGWGRGRAPGAAPGTPAPSLPARPPTLLPQSTSTGSGAVELTAATIGHLAASWPQLTRLQLEGRFRRLGECAGALAPLRQLRSLLLWHHARVQTRPRLGVKVRARRDAAQAAPPACLLVAPPCWPLLGPAS